MLLPDFSSRKESKKYFWSLNEEQKMDAFNEIIDQSEHIVFLGGAGVSTESGIPDFRSKNGLYRKKESRFRKYKPEYLLSYDCLDHKPEIFFDYFRRNLDCRGVEPNDAHRKLAEMERRGKLDGVITQKNDLREDRPNLFYYFYYNEKTNEFFHDREEKSIPGFIQIKPLREDGKEGNWRWGLDTAKVQIGQLIPQFMPSRKVWGVMQKDYLEGRSLVKPTSSWTFKDVNSERGTESFIELGFDKRIFPKPKPVGTIQRCMELGCKADDDAIIFDFFSGSATTAHALLKMNSENGGNRKFVLVQLPEKTEDNSVAFEEGFLSICDIGEERIRRAGSKIKEESPLTTANLDIGFRVFKVDTTNMEDVYYKPNEYNQGQMNLFANNIKPGRTPEDLLFQVMLDLGILLSSKIEETEIAGKKVFSVADGYLIACFDEDVTDETVKAIAQKHPFYAVFRDSVMANDSVMTNFEQIFETYSPKTVRRVL